MAWTAFTPQHILDIGAQITFRDPINSGGPLSRLAGQAINLHVWQSRDLQRIKIISLNVHELVVSDEHGKTWQLKPKPHRLSTIKKAGPLELPTDWIISIQVLP